MSRCLSLLCLSFVFGGGSPLVAAPLSDEEFAGALLPEAPARFQSFFDPSRENGFVTPPADNSDELRGSILLGVPVPRREIQNPTTDESIIWATSRADGPVQALAVALMPNVQEEVPLLVDFRNLSVPILRANLADLPVAFIGQTPDLPTVTLVCCGLGFLLAARPRRTH